MRQIVVGTFDQQDAARAAIAALASDRFDPRRVHAIETRVPEFHDEPAAPPPIVDDSMVDHIIPYSKNGKTVSGNGQLSHRSCNASKNATVLAEVLNAE